MSRAYYNEHDAFAASWLRELIREGVIAPGHVDERDIRDVQPADLAGFDQCHFFAGIGGWSYALRLAGWADARPVWTGSCPCQPFSAAGKGTGFADTRHLWPAWFRLVRECRPPIVFGEQVASPDGLAWFDTVSTDLEAEAYAVGAADLCAAGVGAPHIRQRLFFVADTERGTAERRGHDVGDPARGVEVRAQERQRLRPDARPGGELGPVADAGHDEWTTRTSRREHEPEAPVSERPRGGGADGTLDDTTASGLEGHDRTGAASRGENGGVRGAAGRSTETGAPGGVDDTERDGRERGGLPEHADEQGAPGPEPDGPGPRRPWDGAIWIPCRDGKARPTQPGLFPLASGVPNRVGTLRGAGNAIVPQAAAEFVLAYEASRLGRR